MFRNGRNGYLPVGNQADSVLSAPEPSSFSLLASSDLTVSSVLHTSWWRSCFPYRSQPVLEQEYLHRSQMLGLFQIIAHWTQVSIILQAMMTTPFISGVLQVSAANEDRNLQFWKLLLLAHWIAHVQKRCQAHHHRCRLWTRNEDEKSRALIFLDFKNRFDPSGWGSSGRWESSVHQLLVVSHPLY